MMGGAAAWPLAARAQQPAKLPTIGFLGAATQSGWRSWTDAFVERLHELGWTEGRTITIEYRWAEGRNERLLPSFSSLHHRSAQNMIVELHDNSHRNAENRANHKRGGHRP